MVRDRSQQTCCSRFAGVTVWVVPAAVLTGRSESAATERFSGISVRISTAHSTTKPVQYSLTRRLHSVGGCFSIYAYLRLNTSLRQLQCEIKVTHKTIRRRIERFARALDVSSLDLVRPVEIDEMQGSAGKKDREREVRTTAINHQCSSLLIDEPDTGT